MADPSRDADCRGFLALTSDPYAELFAGRWATGRAAGARGR